MSAHSITLHLPDSLYRRFKNRASKTQRSLEAEILTAVTASAPSEDLLPTGRDILGSGLVGIWEDRSDVQDSAVFARSLRDRAQKR